MDEQADSLLPVDLLGGGFLPDLPSRTAKQLASSCRMLRNTWYRTVRELPRGALFRMRGCKKVQRFPGLHRLDLSKTEAPAYMTDECVASFAELRDLDLTENEDITDSAVEVLTRLERLTLITNVRITDPTLARLTRLTWLSLMNNHAITDAGLRTLSSLKVLELDGASGVTDYAFVRIPHLVASLDVLSLRANTVITDYGVRHLSALSTLVLSTNAVITDAGISTLVTLTSLNLTENTTITDRGIRNLTRLRKLVLDGATGITDGGLRDLRALTDLRLARVHSVDGDDFNALTALEHLDLSNNSSVSGRTLKESGLQNGSLRVLHLSGDTDVRDSVLRRFTALTELRISSNTDISFDGIRELTSLRTLYADNTRMIARVLFPFGHMAATLERLSIGYTHLRDTDVGGTLNLSEAYPQAVRLAALLVLDVRSCYSITAQSLARLVTLRRIVLNEHTGAATGEPVAADTFLALPNLDEVTATRAYFRMPAIRRELPRLRAAGIRLAVVETLVVDDLADRSDAIVFVDDDEDAMV